MDRAVKRAGWGRGWGQFSIVLAPGAPWCRDMLQAGSVSVRITAGAYG
jgi:hypothetical protein